MPIRGVLRRKTVLGDATADHAPMYVDSDDNILKIIPAGSGTTEVQQVDASSTQTLTNKTLTSPTITSPTITGAALSGSIDSDVKVLAATETRDQTTTLATITGMTYTLVAGATYEFDIELPITCTTNGGIAVGFGYTTLTLTSIRANFYVATAADNSTAVSGTSTTTTTATKFVNTKTAAYTLVRLTGTLVVNAGGTLAVQSAQETSHVDVTSMLIGSRARFTRVL